MSHVTTQEQQLTVTADPEPAADPRQDATMKIVAETGVSNGEAERTLDWIAKLTKKARNPKKVIHGFYHLTDAELHTREYRVLDQVMGHGQISKLGSAHAAIERVVLKDNEYGLLHDQVGEQAKYCTVSITVERA